MGYMINKIYILSKLKYTFRQGNSKKTLVVLSQRTFVKLLETFQNFKMRKTEKQKNQKVKLYY